MFKIPIYRDIDQPLFKHSTFHAEIGPFGDDSPNPIPIIPVTSRREVIIIHPEMRSQMVGFQQQFLRDIQQQ